MTCYASALATAAYAGAASHPPSTAAVRLFSLQNGATAGNRVHRSATSKIVHLVRHAEGTHNLSEEESKLPLHYDANLTPRGIEQCRRLARYTQDLQVDAVLVSPMTRCLETAKLSFPHLYGEDDPNKSNDEVRFVAHEEWRETVNYLCDARRPLNVLGKEYPGVCFGALDHEHDPIWRHYEERRGSHTEHTSLRESGDAASLCELGWICTMERERRPGHRRPSGDLSFPTCWSFRCCCVGRRVDRRGELRQSRGFCDAGKPRFAQRSLCALMAVFDDAESDELAALRQIAAVCCRDFGRPSTPRVDRGRLRGGAAIGPAVSK